MRILSIALVFFSCFFSQAYAEKVCLKSVLKSGKILQSVRKVASSKNCAKGYSQILNTELLIGPSGPTGMTGATGTAGADGGFTSVLPSGITITGTFGEYKTTNTDYHVSTYSFITALSAAPTANFRSVGSVPNAACPGTASSPTAAAGNLCLYESIGSNR